MESSPGIDGNEDTRHSEMQKHIYFSHHIHKFLKGKNCVTISIHLFFCPQDTFNKNKDPNTLSAIKDKNWYCTALREMTSLARVLSHI